MGDLNEKSTEYDQNREFVKLFTKHQKNIFFYILSLVSNHSDAEDILQETAGDMWKLFDRYQQGTNFLNWSLTIAKFRVLKFRRNQNKKLQILDDVLFQKLAEELPVRKDMEDRRLALEGCLNRLGNSERILLRLHYEERQTYRSIAKKYHYPERRIYSMMSRIHMFLHDCILQTMLVWRSGV
ncbi:MAG: sigma-70 family RNA polymerase sigma factor [Sedimentisphaerales bacterium]|nr:sigma-70 family RNA polymerase sigma factor [Sedimentisphaerales bacterium]